MAIPQTRPVIRDTLGRPIPLYGAWANACLGIYGLIGMGIPRTRSAIRHTLGSTVQTCATASFAGCSCVSNPKNYPHACIRRGTLQAYGMASRIPNDRPGSWDGHMHYAVYPTHVFAQAPFKRMGWPGESQLTDLLRGMTRRIRPYIPSTRSPRHPSSVWEGHAYP